MPFKVHPQLDPTLEDAAAIWIAGGWAMIAIAVVALVMFAVGMNIYLRLLAKRFEQSWRSSLVITVFIASAYIIWHYLVKMKGQTITVEYWVQVTLVGLGVGAALGALRFGISLLWIRGCTNWPTWIADASKRRGTLGRVLDLAGQAQTFGQSISKFEEVRAQEIKPFARDLIIMRVCVAAAPLLGLLGTVTGMIATFDALTQGSGGEETKGMVAEGISEALITTETGLVIALAGLFLQYQLARKQQRYKALLARMESLCTQHIYRKNQSQRNGGCDDDGQPIRKAA